MFITCAGALAKSAPPLAAEVFAEKVLAVMVTVLFPALMAPPRFAAELPEMVESVRVRLPPPMAIAEIRRLPAAVGAQ